MGYERRKVTDARMKIRLPPSLRDALNMSADLSSPPCSLNRLIVSRLEEKFRPKIKERTRKTRRTPAQFQLRLPEELRLKVIHTATAAGITTNQWLIDFLEYEFNDGF